MSHGERSARFTNNSTREYWSRRLGNEIQPSRPTDGHRDPKSVKRMTRRAERRKARQERRDA